MTISLNKIALTATETTVLDYGFTTNPDPLQINTTGSITIDVSKANPPAATCISLVFNLAIGTSASSLTNSARSITTTCPPGWTVTTDDEGTFTFTPDPGQSTIGPNGLSFILNNIAVNGQVGTTNLTITENLSTGTTSTTLPLSKFPPNFTVSDLTANPPSVQSGGSVTLSWNGSNGDYTLSYGDTAIPNLPSIGNQVIPDLEATTTFTLTVKVTSGNDIVTLQRQFTVTVGQPTINTFGVVGGTLPKVIVKTPLNLYWTTTDTAYCNLALNGTIIATNLPANCTSYPITVPTTPENANYVLYPCDANNAEYASRGFLIATYYQPLLEYFMLDGQYEGNTTFILGTQIQVNWATDNINFCNLALNGTTIAKNLPANNSSYSITVPTTPGSYTYTLTAFDPNNLKYMSRDLTITTCTQPQLLQFDVMGTPSGQTAVVKAGSEFTLEWNASACTGCTIEEISQGTLIGNFDAQGRCPIYAPGTTANLAYAISLTGNDGKTYSHYPMVPVEVED